MQEVGAGAAEERQQGRLHLEGHRLHLDPAHLLRRPAKGQARSQRGHARETVRLDEKIHNDFFFLFSFNSSP